MDSTDHDLHAAKRELEALIARMRGSEHARAFLGYADALVFAALRDLPQESREVPRTLTAEPSALRAAG